MKRNSDGSHPTEWCGLHAGGEESSLEPPTIRPGTDSGYIFGVTKGENSTQSTS